MPANLPPQYYELEREYRAEKDVREKLRMAQELLRIMPKHKGTDKLQAEMKANISRLNKQIAGGAKAHGARQAEAHDHIDNEGAGQVILIGPPNAGKSSIIDALTHAQPLIGDYPYTTREPQAGMMPYETIQIQLIDTPPISSESFENYLIGLIRNADLVLMIADLEAPKFIEDLKLIIKRLDEKRIILKPEVTELPDDPRFSYKKAIVVAHKEYEDESGEKRRRLAELFPGFDTVATSIIDDASLDNLRRAIFKNLGIMRVYTKQIGHEAKLIDPVILPLGGTVEAAAEAIHKDFKAKLKFAKLWGSGKFDGVRVNGDYVLSDGDVVEFHV